MSEKLDLPYRYAEVFNAEGWDGVAEKFWDPEIVWETDPLVPEPGTYYGREDVRRYLEGFSQALGELHLKIKEVVDLGGDDLLAVTTVAGHPLATTERETHFVDWTFLITVRGGKIVRFRSFFDKAKALEAAGRSE